MSLEDPDSDPHPQLLAYTVNTADWAISTIWYPRIFKDINTPEKNSLFFIYFSALPTEEQDNYFLLCDVLPEDRILREELQKQKLVRIYSMNSAL